jgi:hypothetical protein
MSRQPKFYDIANDVVDNFDDIGFIPSYLEDDAEKMIKEYITKNDLQTGDVIFTGSTYESRQAYGFYMVDRSRDDLRVHNEGYYGVEDEEEVEKVTEEFAKMTGVTGMDFTKVNKQVTDTLYDFVW